MVYVLKTGGRIVNRLKIKQNESEDEHGKLQYVGKQKERAPWVASICQQVQIMNESHWAPVDVIQFSHASAAHLNPSGGCASHKSFS